MSRSTNQVPSLEYWISDVQACRLCIGIGHQGVSEEGIPGFGAVYGKNIAVIFVFLVCIIITGFSGAAELDCRRGEPAVADLGDGVIMRTCLWQKTADVTVRSGGLELLKNGVLILKLETDVDGKLHGRFTSWNDAGEITQNGNYSEGLKEGPWTVTNEEGYSEILHYRAGVIVEP